jgi:hypothetical protein
MSPAVCFLEQPTRVFNSRGWSAMGKLTDNPISRHYGDALRIDPKIARYPGVGISSEHAADVSNE